MVLALRRIGGLGRRVGVVNGVAGQRQDFAGMRIHHYHAAAGGAVGRYRGRQLALRDELQALVDGQGNRQSGLGSHGGLGVDPAALHVGEHALGAGSAAKILVEGLLHSGVALTLEIHGSQHVGRKRAFGIVPLGLTVERDSIHRQVAEIVAFLPTEIARHHQVSAAVVARGKDAPVKLVLILVEFGRKNVGRNDGIDLEWIDVNGIDRDAHRQGRAGAVKNASSGGRYRDDYFLARPRDGRILAMMHDLELDQGVEDGPAPEQDTAHQDYQTPLRHIALRDAITPPESYFTMATEESGLSLSNRSTWPDLGVTRFCRPASLARCSGLRRSATASSSVRRSSNRRCSSALRLCSL